MNSVKVKVAADVDPATVVGVCDANGITHRWAGQNILALHSADFPLDPKVIDLLGTVVPN